VPLIQSRKLRNHYTRFIFGGLGIPNFSSKAPQIVQLFIYSLLKCSTTYLSRSCK